MGKLRGATKAARSGAKKALHQTDRSTSSWETSTTIGKTGKNAGLEVGGRTYGNPAAGTEDRRVLTQTRRKNIFKTYETTKKRGKGKGAPTKRKSLTKGERGTTMSDTTIDLKPRLLTGPHAHRMAMHGDYTFLRDWRPINARNFNLASIALGAGVADESAKGKKSSPFYSRKVANKVQRVKNPNYLKDRKWG